MDHNSRTTLETDETDRTLDVEPCVRESGGERVYLYDSETADGIYVNTLDLLQAIALATGYKVTVDYTPVHPSPVHVVYGG